jgi:hypothetical protein
MQNTVSQANLKCSLHKAISGVTAIIEKYTDQIALLDVIDIVDNLKILADIAENKPQNTNVHVA